MALPRPHHPADSPAVCGSAPLLPAELFVNEDRETNLRKNFYLIFLNSAEISPQAVDQNQQGSPSFVSACI